ncbi:MAG: hypothetical protein QXZ25_01020 [Candidatus Bathyarchaeia archaeon]
MKSNIPQNWNIFTALHDAIREKALNQLRFAKCTFCGRLTPYRLKFTTENTVRCKKCGNLIQLDVGDKYNGHMDGHI